MSAQKELEFKRRWQRHTKDESEENVIFGRILGAKWSRVLDSTTFGQLETFLGIKSSQTLLDIGCGPLARAEVYFSSKVFRVVGLDISRVTLKKAQKWVRKYCKVGNVDFVLGDAEFLPFKDDKFDTTLCIGAISHLPTVKNVIKAVGEIKRVARPHGTIYITFWLNLYSFSGIQDALMLRLFDALKIDRAQFLKFKGVGEINSIFNYVGLKIEKIRYGALAKFPQYLFYFTPSFVKKILHRITSVINEYHQSHSLFSGFSTVFEVKCKNVPPPDFKPIKPNAYYEFF